VSDVWKKRKKANFQTELTRRQNYEHLFYRNLKKNEILSFLILPNIIFIKET